MLQGDRVIEHQDKVRRDLNSRNVDDYWVTGLTGLAGPGVVEGGDSEPVHDPVQDVGQSAPWLKPLVTTTIILSINGIFGMF